jgi:hypothetical protein
MKNKVILMEAFKVIHAPQYSFLDDFVKKYAPFAATFSTNKYSSRMPDVKNGIFKSVFWWTPWKRGDLRYVGLPGWISDLAVWTGESGKSNEH